MSGPKLPCWMVCPSCGHREWCSAEDPDAGQSEMWRHIYWDHALPGAGGLDTNKARATTGQLLAKAEVIPDA
ncbi:hypothetical protein Drose_04525 [Dactylosporangium roseum]|uniref:Uncharacterized protein n=1 Tax=Dactylosporangium roseum TaxID=47989 RepID=A0ABY5Z667_9ACTN|nr:hypothetical protein [Dactylosporangium roseum]UWZ37555.1 hypothetical protein Drose_04525 [Dactylosporangium roseum]